MSTEKVNYKEAFINFNPQKFCDQFAKIMSKNSDRDITITAVKKTEADKN